MKSDPELLFSVIERYLVHTKKTQSPNPVVRKMAKEICEIEIWEMWVLTQK